MVHRSSIVLSKPRGAHRTNLLWYVLSRSLAQVCFPTRYVPRCSNMCEIGETRTPCRNQVRFVPIASRNRYSRQANVSIQQTQMFLGILWIPQTNKPKKKKENSEANSKQRKEKKSKAKKSKVKQSKAKQANRQTTLWHLWPLKTKGTIHWFQDISSCASCISFLASKRRSSAFCMATSTSSSSGFSKVQRA